MNDSELETASPDFLANYALTTTPNNASDRQLRVRAKLIGEAASRRLAAGALFAERWEKAKKVAETQEAAVPGETPDQEEIRKRAAFELMQKCLLEVDSKKLPTGKHDRIGSMWKQGGFDTGAEAFAFMSNLVRNGTESAITEDYKNFRKLDYAAQVAEAKRQRGIGTMIKGAIGEGVAELMKFGDEPVLSDYELGMANEDVKKANDVLRWRDEARARGFELGQSAFGAELGVAPSEGKAWEPTDEEKQRVTAASKTIVDFRQRNADEAIRSDYEAKLVKKNAWVALSQILPTLDEPARECAEAMLNSSDGALPISMSAQFENLSERDQDTLIQVRNLLKPYEESGVGNTISDAVIGAANIGIDVLTSTYRQGQKLGNVIYNGFADVGVDVNEINRRRQKLWEVSGSFFAGGDLTSATLPQLQFEQSCADHGLVAEAVIGAFSTLPYMFMAGASVAKGESFLGVTMNATRNVGMIPVALEAMNQFDDHTAAQGGDITNPGYIVRSALMGGLYAYVEKMQLEKLLGGVGEMEVRAGMLKGFWAGVKNGTVPKVLFTTTLNESVEEGLQASIMAFHEALALDKNVSKEMVDAFIDDFTNSLGTMMVIGAGGIVLGHAKRSGFRGGEIGRVNRSKDLTDVARQSFAIRALVRSNEFSDVERINVAEKELFRYRDAWKTGGVKALVKAGLTEERAAELDQFYTAEKEAREDAAEAKRIFDERKGDKKDTDAAEIAEGYERMLNGDIEEASFLELLKVYGMDEVGAEKYLKAIKTSLNYKEVYDAEIDKILPKVTEDLLKAQMEFSDEDRRAQFEESLEFIKVLRDAWARGKGVVGELEADEDGQIRLKGADTDPGAAALKALGLSDENAKELSLLFHKERANLYSAATIKGVRDLYEKATKNQVSPEAAFASAVGGRLEKINGETFIRFKQGLVKIEKRGNGLVDYKNTSDAVATSIEEATGGRITAEQWKAASDAERKEWSKGIVDEGGFTAVAGLDTVLKSSDANKLLGTIRIAAESAESRVIANYAPLQDSSVIFHETFHGFSRFMNVAGIWSEEDLKKLEKKYGKAREANETFNEESAAEAFRAYLRRRMAGAMTQEDEKDGVFAKLFSFASSMKRADAAEKARAKTTKTAEEAFFDQIAADTYKELGDLAEKKPEAPTAKTETGKTTPETPSAPTASTEASTEAPVTPAPAATPAPTRAGAAATGWSAATPTGNVRVKGSWQVFKLSDLIHSNNPLYAKFMRNQLRNRKDNKAEESKREEIINNFDPARLFEAPDTANGAPIVFLDKDENGVIRPFVLSGNGRVLVLNTMAERHLFDQYRNFMRNWAKENGLEVPEGDYVVVRVIEDYGGATREQVADLSNTNSIQQYTEEEQARADAEVIKNNDLARLYHANQNGSADMTPGVNDEFFRGFINGVGDTSLLNSDGSVTESARVRAVRALLAIAVGQGDRGRDVVKKLIEQTDTLSIVRQKNAAVMMAAAVASLENDANYAIGPDVSRAMADFIDFAEKKKAGKISSFADYYAQLDLLDGPSEVARGILGLLGSAKGALEIAEYVNKFVETAKASDADGGLFGAAAARTKTDIWNDVKKLLDEKGSGVKEEKVSPVGSERLSLSSNLFSAVNPYYEGDVRDVVLGVKGKNERALKIAAASMARFVREGDVLVPVPGHLGHAEDTLALAEAISSITGTPVVDALKSPARESVYEQKKLGVLPTAADLGISRIRELPSDRRIVLLDNVVGTGTTAYAAREAAGGGEVLAFAYDVTSPVVDGLSGALVERKALRADPRRKQLLAVHNMKVSDIRNVAELGGFAMPSIAVVKDTDGHKEFGEVSVLFDRNTIDPKKNRQNALYSHDAWTPTFPEIYNKIDEKGIEKTNDKIREMLSEDLRNALSGEFFEFINSDGIHKAFDSASDAADAYAYHPVMKAAYLVSKGEKVEVVFREAKYSSRWDNEELRAIHEKFGDKLYEIREKALESDEREDAYREIFPELKRFLMELVDSGPERAEKNAERKRKGQKTLGELLYGNVEYGDDKLDFWEIAKIAEAVHDYITYGDRKEVDTWGTKRAIEERVDSSDESYRAWINAQYSNPILGKGVWNGKSRRTPSGNLRNWDSIHDPATLENIVKAMRKTSLANGAKTLFGRNPYGVAVRKFSSIKDLVANEGLLKPLTREEEKAIKDELNQRLLDLGSRYMESNKDRSDNQLVAFDRAMDMIYDAWEESHGLFSGFTRLLNGWGYSADEKFAREIFGVLEEMSMMPTNYFEAKPQRAVGFDETRAWIVPDTISAENRKLLEDHGQKIFTYKAGDEEDRRRVLNTAADQGGERFSFFAGVNGVANMPDALFISGNQRVAREMVSGRDWDKIPLEEKRRIKVATGWEIGADGKWRYEIDDIPSIPMEKITATKNNDELTIGDRTYLSKYTPVKLGDLWPKKDRKAIELFKAYPFLKNVTIVYGSFGLDEGTNGSCDDANFIISLNDKNLPTADKVRSTLTHEIQHLIQKIEDFARGGNTRSVGKMLHKRFQQAAKEADAYYEKIREFIAMDPDWKIGEINYHIWLYRRQGWREYKATSPEVKAATAWLKSKEWWKEVEADAKWIRKEYGHDPKFFTNSWNGWIYAGGKESMDGYFRLAGEVEARNASHRIAIPRADRSSSLAEETEFNPRDLRKLDRKSQILIDGEYNQMLKALPDAQERHMFISLRGGNALGITPVKDPEAMEARGETRDEIYRETGWWRAADGKWRVELPFTGKFNREGGPLLRDYFEWPELFNAYPMLSETRVSVETADEMNGAWGEWDAEENTIHIWEGLKKGLERQMYLVGSLVHEMQHAIQELELLAPGGNPAQFDADPNASEKYHRLAGEVEARNAAERIFMPARAKLEYPPWVTQDVADSNQIIVESERYSFAEIRSSPTLDTELDVEDFIKGKIRNFRPGVEWYIPLTKDKHPMSDPSTRPLIADAASYATFKMPDLNKPFETTFAEVKNGEERYSIRQDQTRSLIAVHGLRLSSLKSASNSGGLLMPSTAIVDSSMGWLHHGYMGIGAGIYMLFPKSTIDSGRVDYYNGDAYTPTVEDLIREGLVDKDGKVLDREKIDAKIAEMRKNFEPNELHEQIETYDDPIRRESLKLNGKYTPGVNGDLVEAKIWDVVPFSNAVGAVITGNPEQIAEAKKILEENGVTNIRTIDTSVAPRQILSIDEIPEGANASFLENDFDDLVHYNPEYYKWKRNYEDQLRQYESEMAERFSMHAWPKDFPRVPSLSTRSYIERHHHDLFVKGKAGNLPAALELVNAIVDRPKSLETVKALAAAHPNAIYIPVIGVEKPGENALPYAYARKLSQVTPLDYTSNIHMVDKPNHTGADRLYRLQHHAFFKGSVTRGREYIIVDDHITSGATIRDLKNYITERGGKVVAATTLTFSRYSGILSISDESKLSLRKAGITDELLFKKGIAYGIEDLTESEARFLYGVSDPRGRIASLPDSSELGEGGRRNPRPEAGARNVGRGVYGEALPGTLRSGILQPVDEEKDRTNPDTGKPTPNGTRWAEAKTIRGPISIELDEQIDRLRDASSSLSDEESFKLITDVFSRIADTDEVKKISAESVEGHSFHKRDDEINDPKRQAKWKEIHDIIFAPIVDLKNNPDLKKRFERGMAAPYEPKIGHEAHIVVGPPAAGKSSVFVVPLSLEYKARVIDADIIKTYLPGFADGNGAGYVHEESSYLNKKFLKEAMGTGVNLVVPIVGSDEGKLINDYIKPLREAGYKVVLHNNVVPIVHATHRSLCRTLSTGRWLSPSLFTSVLNKPTAAFEAAKGMVEAWDSFSNDVGRKDPPRFLGSSEGYLEHAYADVIERQKAKERNLFEGAAKWPLVKPKLKQQDLFPAERKSFVANPNAVARESFRADLQDNRNKVAENALVNYVAYFKLAHGTTPKHQTIAKLGLAMGMNVVSSGRVLKKADELAEKTRGTLIEKAAGNGDVETAMTLFKRQNDLDHSVDKLVSGGIAAGGQLTHLGVGTINSTIAKRVEQMMKDFSAATLADMEGETGLDIAAEILANNPDAFDGELKKAKGLDPEKPQGDLDDDEGSGGGDGEDESSLSDYERFRREEARKAALKKVEEFIAAAKARAEENRRKAEERRANAPDGNFEGGSGDGLEPGGASGGANKDAPKNVKAGFKSKEEFAAFMRVWAEDRFTRQHGHSTLGRTERERLFAEFYRITVRQELQDLADKLLAPRGARAYVNRRLAEFEKGLKPDTIERMSANIFAFINKAAIRESKNELVKKFKLELKEKFLKGKDFEELKLDSDRRVTGWVEEATRYICRVCDLSRREINGNPSQLARERKELLDILEKRSRVYDESGKEVASAAKEDLETKKALWKLALLDKYGAMTSLMPGEILDLRESAMNYLESEAAKLEQLWKDARRFEDEVRVSLARGIQGPKGQRYQEKGLLNGRLFDALNGMIRLRLKHLTRFAPEKIRGEAENAINKILVLLGDGETAYNRALQDDRAEFFRGLGGIFQTASGRADTTKIRAYLNRMTEAVPVELSRKISNQGFAESMTWGQALQLLVSLEQRSFKDAVKENGREGQAEEIRKHLSIEDIKFVDWLRAFYAAKRETISPVLERMVGLGVDSPDPLYCPVKRWMGDRTRDLHLDPSPRWDAIGSVFSRRVENLRDFDETASVVGMFFNRSDETAKLVAWAERGTMLRGIFTSQQIQSTIRNAFGSAELGKILKQLEATFNGGETKSKTPGELAAVDKALNFTTYAYLGFNPLSAAKQTTSFTVWANALPGGFKDLWKYMTSFDAKIVKHLKESDEYKVRYGNDIGSGQNMATKGLNANPSANPIVQMFTGASMWLLKKGDFVPGAWIAQGVYKDRLDMHLQEGMEFEAADKLALTETFNLLEETQQSGRTYNTNMLTLEHGRIGRMLTQFATSALQQLQYETQAYREYRDMKRYDMGEEKIAKAREKLLRAVVINHLLLPAAMNFVAAVFKAAVGAPPPWEEEGWHWSLLTEILLGQFSRVFFVGVFSQTALNAFFSRKAPRMGQMLPVEGSLGMATSVAFTAHDLVTLNPENLQKDLRRLLKSSAPTRIGLQVYENYFEDEPKKK